MQSPATLGPWAGVGDDDLAARVEPRLNAWLARLLGDPAKYVFGAKVLVPPVDTGRSADRRRARLRRVARVSLAELGLSPLALVLQSEAQQGGGQSGVQERIAAVLSAQSCAPTSAPPPTRWRCVLQRDAPHAGRIGLVGVRVVRLAAAPPAREDARRCAAWTWCGPRTASRPTRRRTTASSPASISPSSQAALAVAESAAQAVLDALTGGDRDRAATRGCRAHARPARRRRRWRCFASCTPALAQALRARLAQRAARASASRRRRARRRASAGRGRRHASRARSAACARCSAEIAGRLDAARRPPVSPGRRRPGRAQRSIASTPILGKALPGAAAVHARRLCADAAATLGDRDDAARPATTISRSPAGCRSSGCVREATGAARRRADRRRSARGAATRTTRTISKLLQFPRDAAARWARAAAGAGAGPARRGRGRGACAGARSPSSRRRHAARRTVRRRMDRNRSRRHEETTGLGFHFDAPGARPPQSILLAVPADPAAQNWTLDGLRRTSSTRRWRWRACAPCGRRTCRRSA